MSQKQVLIVEDDPDGQELVATILTHMNISVQIAASAEQAEVLLFQQHHSYAAAVMDLALPNKDGWTLLEQIRTSLPTHLLCCIAITAYHTSKLRQEALRAGFNAYFPKPLNVASFTQYFATLL